MDTPESAGERPAKRELDRNGLPVLTAEQLRAYLASRPEELSPVLAAYGEQLGSRLDRREQESLKLRDTPHAFLVPYIGASVREYVQTVENLSTDCYHGSTPSGDPVPAELCGLSDGEYVDMAREALSTWPREIAGEEFAQHIATLVDLGP
jgi:hypothetical protein